MNKMPGPKDLALIVKVEVANPQGEAIGLLVKYANSRRDLNDKRFDHTHFVISTDSALEFAKKLLNAAQQSSSEARTSIGVSERMQSSADQKCGVRR